MINSIEVSFSMMDAILSEPAPDLITLTGVVVSGQSAGDLKGLLAWAHGKNPQTGISSQHSSESPSSRIIPPIEIHDVHFVDQDEIFTTTLPYVKWVDGRLEGAMTFQESNVCLMLNRIWAD